MTEEFGSWDQWKKRNLEGLNCCVKMKRKGNKVVTIIEHAGLRTQTTTTIKGGESGEIYAALTGDLVALTDIRIEG